jgi:hypothetical protein
MDKNWKCPCCLNNCNCVQCKKNWIKSHNYGYAKNPLPLNTNNNINNNITILNLPEDNKINFNNNISIVNIEETKINLLEKEEREGSSSDFTNLNLLSNNGGNLNEKEIKINKEVRFSMFNKPKVFLILNIFIFYY